MSNAPSNSDPKFTPAASSLGKIGMKVGDIKTDEALIAFVARGQKSRQLSEAQEAVAVYVARKRGHEFPWITANLGLSESTAKRREIEGMAILRLHVDEADLLRTVNAIRTAGLGLKVVDEITSEHCTLNDDNQDERMLKLEDVAAAAVIKAKYTASEGSDQPLSDTKAAEVVAAAKQVVTRQVQPINTSNIVAAAAHAADEAKVSVRKTKRTPQPPVTSGPSGLNVHLTAAMKDMDRMEEAADGEAYWLTPQDWAALFLLLGRFDLALEPTEAVIAAMEEQA